MNTISMEHSLQSLLKPTVPPSRLNPLIFTTGAQAKPLLSHLARKMNEVVRPISPAARIFVFGSQADGRFRGPDEIAWFQRLKENQFRHVPSSDIERLGMLFQEPEARVRDTMRAMQTLVDTAPTAADRRAWRSSRLVYAILDMQPSDLDILIGVGSSGIAFALPEQEIKKVADECLQGVRLVADIMVWSGPCRGRLFEIQTGEWWSHT